MRKARGGDYRLHMLRDYSGVPVHSYQQVVVKNRYTSVSYSWTTPLSKTPHTLFEVADKSLSSTGKAIKEAFSDHSRCWTPTYKTQVHSSDLELDKRFVFYGQDAAAVRFLINQPGMRDLLLGCAEVDLVVSANEVSFSDPAQKNLRAAMAGKGISTDVMKMTELSIPVHDHIAALLARTAELCTQNHVQDVAQGHAS